MGYSNILSRRTLNNARRVATLFVLGAFMPAAAQVTTGSITGYVLDPANRPIAGAKVAASDSLHSTIREAVTDGKGLYYLSLIHILAA